MDGLDDDIQEPKLPTAPEKKMPVSAVDRVRMIAPRTVDEAWRLAGAFVQAKMVPESLQGANVEETQAKCMIVLMKGLEVGIGPATALQTIMVVNGKPCIYGDGVTALLQKSGVVEYIKTEITGDPNVVLPEKADYKVTVTLKRKDQSEPIIRSFSYQDAIKAGLINKKGPWSQYRARQCYWRAYSWAVRDGASDALMGLAIAEEVQDYITTKQRDLVTDTSALDD